MALAVLACACADLLPPRLKCTSCYRLPHTMPMLSCRDDDLGPPYCCFHLPREKPKTFLRKMFFEALLSPTVPSKQSSQEEIRRSEGKTSGAISLLQLKGSNFYYLWQMAHFQPSEVTISTIITWLLLVLRSWPHLIN